MHCHLSRRPLRFWSARTAAGAVTFGLALLAGPGGVAGDALAQPKVDPTVDALVDEAGKLEEAGKLDAATGRLARAYALEERPTIGMRLARLYVRAGKLLDAQSVYRAVASSEARKAADKKAVASAAVELEQLASRVPMVKIAVQGEAAGRVLVVLGSRKLPANTWMEIDPGRHLLEVRGQGFAPRFVSHEASIGQRQVVSVDLLPQSAAPIAGAPGGVPGAAVPPGDSGGSAARGVMLSLGWTAIGMSVINLSIGSLAGAAVLSAKSDLDAQCVEDPARFGDDEKHCPTFSSLSHATAEASAGLATFGFVLGTLLLGGGITLVVLAPSSDESEGPPPVNMQVQATPNGMMLRGTF
jgi:hypothetical protein